MKLTKFWITFAVLATTTELCFGIGFQTPVEYRTPGHKVGLVAADFNGDGHLDLATANAAATTLSLSISVLLGNGDGTFQPARTIDLPNYVLSLSQLATGDLNKDGFSDLIFTAGPDLNVFLSNGDGSFQRGLAYTGGGDSEQLAINDFDRDGNLDVLERSTDNSIDFFAGRGDGSLDAPLHTFVLSTEVGLAVADFNQDGILDVAITERADRANIYDGNGDGTFVATFAFKLNRGGGLLAAGDFNNDGFPDVIATAGGQGKVTVALNDGTGRVVQQFNSNVGGSGGAYGLALADFDRNGNLDAAVGVRESNLDIALGNGDGTLSQTVRFATDAGPQFVVTGDFNEDGYVDAAMAGNGMGIIAVTLNDGPPKARQAQRR